MLIVTAFALVFFYAPNDADQGFIQKIFYLHVPLAITALVGFVVGGIYGIRYLRSGDRAHDLRSYVVDPHGADLRRRRAAHRLDLGARRRGVTGGCGTSRRSCRFLIVFLLYACYQPLRFSIEDPERQSRYAAVFAIVGGVFVPLNFVAVRSATQDIHPRTLSRTPTGCRARSR